MNNAVEMLTASARPLHMKTSHAFLAATLAAILAACAAPGTTAEPRPPNVVLILADDLGYETLGSNGGTSYTTPVLDGLAASGARFTHCYAQPLCTPTRVQLMTGLSNVRNYIDFGTIDPRAVTFGTIFKRAGYATCITGKWQLGRDRDLPRRLGFDESCLWQHTRRPPRYANPGLEIDGVEVDFSSGEYGPDIVSNHACDFVARNASRPFFLYYPMMLTHAPFQPTPDSPDWDPTARGEHANQAPRHFGEMVAYMDKLIGKLVDTLDTHGLRDDTLILFLGDNGTGRGVPSRMGDREVIGGKGSTTEAGMHVPLVASWPGRIRANTVCDDLVDTTDFLPTIAAVAGVDGPELEHLDGRSFLPQLLGERGTPRDWIYSWYAPREGGEAERAVEFAFDRRFKLYRDGRFFDLASDRAEKRPLAVAALEGDAAAAAIKLRAAIDSFADARPATPRCAAQRAAP